MASSCAQPGNASAQRVVPAVTLRRTSARAAGHVGNTPALIRLFAATACAATRFVTTVSVTNRTIGSWAQARARGTATKDSVGCYVELPLGVFLLGAVLAPSKYAGKS